MEPRQELDRIREELGRVEEQFGRVIVGNQGVLRFMLKALLTGGHLLLEGMPGLGKTLMVKVLARLLALSFSRVQFTPDLQPTDIIGTNILLDDERGGRHFRFERGPVFTNVLLADEVNRASPKTQSALLQAMEERECTVFGESHPLDDVFFVMATQNPIEMAGTYPLPEAQLDRFLCKLTLDSPSLDTLKAIARRNATRSSAGPGELPRVLTRDRVLEIQQFLGELPLTDRIYDFASELVHGTHPDASGAPAATRKYLRYGASPRGVNALLATARVSALADGRFNVAVEDLEENYLACLRHRVILNFEGEVEGVSPDSVLKDLFHSVRKRFP